MQQVATSLVLYGDGSISVFVGSHVACEAKKHVDPQLFFKDVDVCNSSRLRMSKAYQDARPLFDDKLNFMTSCLTFPQRTTKMTNHDFHVNFCETVKIENVAARSCERKKCAAGLVKSNDLI